MELSVCSKFWFSFCTDFLINLVMWGFMGGE